MPREDLALVAKCATGDKEAWDVFVRKTRPAILRGAAVALRKFRIRDQDTVDTVEQEVFTELLRDDHKVLRTYKGKSDLEGWVAVIAMRTAYRVLRKSTRETALPEILPPDPTPSPEERAGRAEFLDRLDRAFRELTKEERGLLTLSFFEKQSYKEIADALNMPLNSVSPKIIRAKERLKKLLE